MSLAGRSRSWLGFASPGPHATHAPLRGSLVGIDGSRGGLSIAALSFAVLGACGGKVVWVPSGDGGASSTSSNAKSSNVASSHASTSAGFGGSPDAIAVGVGGAGPACGGDQNCFTNDTGCGCSGTCYGNKISSMCSTASDPQCECFINGAMVGGCFGGVATSCDLLSGCCGQYFYMTTAPPNPP